MPRLDSFLRLVAEQRVSDLHFHAGSVPIIRHDGELTTLPFRTLSAAESRRFLYEILTPEQQRELEEERQIDFIYVIPEVGRFRASVFHQCHGLGSVFRVVAREIPTLAQLGMPEAIRSLTQQGNGLVIVTGPTGSGKTTTLAAMVHEINSTAQRHVITIEDPIEFVHEPIQSVVTQREVGRHTESFASGLRSALRESPDVVVIGEMRDLETIQLALTAAETGVLVLGTLHTNSAAKAIDRILDVIPEDAREQARGLLSGVLRGVVAQRLCRRATEEGRVAAVEVLLHGYAVANMIRENKVHLIDSHLQSAATDGSGTQSLDSSLLQHVRNGAISAEEALGYARYPEQLQRQIAELGDEA
jgi:twitching motility protein PilT